MQFTSDFPNGPSSLNLLNTVGLHFNGLFVFFFYYSNFHLHELKRNAMDCMGFPFKFKVFNIFLNLLSVILSYCPFSSGKNSHK